MTVGRTASIAFLAGFIGCSGGVTGSNAPGGGQSIGITVYPQVAETLPGGSAAFGATVTGTADVGVIWQVVEASGGTIDTAGHYTAPQAAGTYHVKASSHADPSVYSTAMANVLPAGSVTWPTPGSNAACANEPIHTGSTCGPNGNQACPVYYACDCQAGADPNCVLGSDSNNGTSPSTPFQTEAKLRSYWNGLITGGTLAYCKGGSFTHGSNLNLNNYNCTAANPCILRDYVDPRWTLTNPNQKPIILGASGGFDNGGAAHHKEGVIIENLRFQGSGSGVGVFIRNDADDITLCNLEIDNFSLGVQHGSWDSTSTVCSGTPTPPWPACCYSSNGGQYPCSSERTKIIGCKITNSYSASGAADAMLVFSDDMLIRDNLMVNNGSTGNLTHSFYLESEVLPNSNPANRFQTVRESIINNEFHAGHNGTCNGTIFAGHGQHDYLTIEHNLFVVDPGTTAQSGCWGLQISNGPYGQSLGSWFRHMVIRGNTVQGVAGPAITFGSAPGVLVENNLIINTASTSTGGIWVGSTPATSTSGVTDDVTANAVVRNNTVYCASGSGCANNVGIGVVWCSGSSMGCSTGATPGLLGGGNIITNNAVYYDGTNTGFACYQQADFPACSNSGYAHTFALADYNQCYTPNVTQHWIAGGTSLANFQGSAGCPDNGVAASMVTDQHSIWADPQFTSVASPYSFLPLATSPLLNAADPVQFAPTDITGAARDSTPDIGAYEWR